MFESTEKLADDIDTLLGAIREMGRGRYACLMEPQRILFENAVEPMPGLRRFLLERSTALFSIPSGLAGGGPMEDAFEGWDEDEFFLAFINGRAVVVVACPHAEPLREQARRPLKALADRLFRYDARFRLDRRGRGFFFGGGTLDLVVVGRANGSPG